MPGRNGLQMKRVSLKDLADIKLCIALPCKKDSAIEAVWITQSALLPFNAFGEFMPTTNIDADKSLKAEKHDILIKRVAPTGVNYIEDDTDAYVYNNLFIVRAREGVDSSYLAAYLDQNIEEFVNLRAGGAVVLSVGRKDLSEMSIVVPEERVQKAVGGYWLEYNKKKRIENRLTAMEKQRNKALIQKITSENGGKR